jgi:Leucine-rich repeat (LRR) protein
MSLPPSTLLKDWTAHLRLRKHINEKPRNMIKTRAGLGDCKMILLSILCLVALSGIGSSNTTLFVAADDQIHDDNSVLSASEILLKVYDETRGLRWDQHTNWLQNTDVCTWYGVTCYDETVSDQRRVGHIQKLDLSANRLLGTVPQEVFQLPYVEVIDVRDNPDVSISFEGIGDAQYLKALAFSNTNVKSLDGIGAAKQLNTLHITSLGITGALPLELFDLTNLVGLYANYNKFSGSLPSQIGQLRYLTELYLFDSELTGQIPSEIGLLSNIQVLTLAENAFGGTLPTEFNKCTQLTTLAVNRAFGQEKGPGISGGLPSFSGMTQMADLRLQNQMFSGPIPSDFLSSAPQQEVVKVELTNNQLTGSVPSGLADLKRLNLFIADNQIVSVPETLCSNADWMGGNVGSLGCDGLLCRPGTSAPEGRATPDEACNSCTSAQFWGSSRCSASPSTTTMGYTEREVLVNLYNKMGGRYWKNDDGWLNPAEDVCNWYGIECEEGKVTGLLLKNNDLSNSPPVELFSLPELKHIDFESNAVDFQFKGIGNAGKLVTLLLSSCELSSLEDIGALSSTSIRQLSLASNYLEGSLPEEIFDIASLEDLDLSHNHFTGSLSSKIGSLFNLQTLQITKNKLNGQLPATLGNLILLKELSASENNFSGSLPTELESLTRLEKLSIHQTASTNAIGGPLPAFRNLAQLNSIQLDSNNLSGSLPADFLSNTVGGEAAVEVRLSDNVLQGEIPDVWGSRFQNLFLDLSGNKITGIGQGLCQKSQWLEGSVGLFACNAILCPPGQFNEFGRQTGADSPCRSCTNQGSVQFYGSKTCDDSVNNAVQATSETGILQEFFSSTDGNNWKNNDGWMSSNSPCDGWYGIECNADGKVVAIEMESNGLAGTPSSEIFMLSSLRTLNLKGNQIKFSFDGISRASNLAVLILSGTNLESVAGISQATGLTELHLTDNSLKGSVPDDILSLSNLRKLYLNYNQLSGKIPPSIANLKNLEELFLYNNRLGGQLPASIGLLARLKHLSLAENSFTGTLPPELNDLTNLEVLSIQREGGTDEGNVGIDQGANYDLGAGIGGPLLAFDNLKYLKKLYLGSNSLSGSIPYNFLDGVVNKALSLEVDLTANRLTGQMPPALTQFDGLSIYVAGNRISGIADGLCRKDGWMEGAVSDFACDAILCPPGTFSAYGRQKDSSSECLSCRSGTTAEYYGSFKCLGEESQQSLSERTILEDLYRATEGDVWKSSTNWLDSGESICTWFGVTCVPDKESVASLHLSGNGLRGSIPSEIFDLPNLKEIDLSQNPVDLSFSGISKAKNLEYLNIDESNLSSLSGLGMASTLKLLHIANTKLDEQQFPQEILSLTGLQSLDLSGNPIGIVPSLASHKNLAYFACSQCGINGNIPVWLNSMTNLEHLQLDGNSLTGTLPRPLLNLTDLKYLNFADQVSSGGQGLSGSLLDFAGLKNLQELYLQRNNIGGSLPSTFLGDVSTSETVTVDIRFNNLTGAIPLGLTRISDLKLYLANNRIDSIPDGICSMSWNELDGTVSNCDYILCNKGTFNALGRATPKLPCTPCNEEGYALFYGSTECGPAFEKQLIYGLFESLGGLQWTHSDGWQDHDDVCSWYGVTCYEGGYRDGHVQKIDLSDNNLKGTLSAPIWGLVHMKELDLRKNDIVVTFDGIANAQSLETLHLSETKVSTIAGIGAAPSLKYLHLTNCAVSGEPFSSSQIVCPFLRKQIHRANACPLVHLGPLPEELFEMTQLNGLYLNYNELTGTLPGSLGELSQLQELYLFHNELNGTLPTEIGLLEHVEILSLGENKFTGKEKCDGHSFVNVNCPLF